MKKIILAHPYRHHSYYTLAGIQNYSKTAYGCYGYYKCDDIIDRIVEKSTFSSKLKGYRSSLIDETRIILNPMIKIDFLLAKAEKKYATSYLRKFDLFAKKKVKDFDFLHVLQDYCNETIREAYRLNMPIIYEQIQPFDLAQVEWITREVEEAGFQKSYIGNRFPQKKLEMQFENLEMSTAIVCASMATKNSLKGITDKPVYTFPYGADLLSCDKQKLAEINLRRSVAKQIKVLYVGTINLIKGVRYIIAAARKLEKEPIEFTFVGKTFLDEDKKLIEDIRSLNNCNYINNVPHSEINALYQSHDIFVFQGLCEGFGMVTLEAMSNGLPCVVSEGGCGIVTDGEDGFINPNCDTESIVNNLMKLCSDRELLIRMGTAAHNNVERYTWQRFSDSIENLYIDEFGDK